ncbi:MAG: response regulator, partial [Pseudomonadales bacterium]|nr:response regulator [Pseudomonadales bacterium]
TQSFLQTQKNDPLFHRLLNIVMLLSCSIFIGFYLDDFRYSAMASGISAVLILITVVLAAVCSVKRGYKPARYFAIAFISVIVGAMLYTLKSFGLLPANWFTVYSLQIGSAMEVVLLSLGLASRINLLKAEKAGAEKLAYETQISTNKLKDEFISTITHELLTPINGIKLSLDLARKMEAPPNLKNLVCTAQDSTAHLHRLVDSMLTFVEAKRGSMKLSLASKDLRKSLESEFDQFREFKQPNVKMDFEWDNKLPNYVMLDAKKLQVLLIQLLKNAVAHTSSGSIVMKVFQCDETKFTVEITDTGTGIEPAKLQTVFEAFHQLDGSMARDYGGLGLGLAIVKDLLNLMGGTLDIDSKFGKGTCVSFTLPITLPAKSSVSANQQSPIDDVKLPCDTKILVVEDNPVNLMLLCKILEQEGIEVERASNGLEAIEMAKSTSDIGAILMDCQMPVMDGYKATREIRKLEGYSHIPIIAVTANISERDKDKCIGCGMNDVLNKPTGKDVVLESLSYWLRKK